MWFARQEIVEAADVVVFSNPSEKANKQIAPPVVATFYTYPDQTPTKSKMAQVTPNLSTLENALIAKLAKSTDKSSSSEEKSERFVELLKAATPELIESSLTSYRAASPEMLKESRAEVKKFEEGTFARWEVAFDHLETIWNLAAELGEENDKDLQSSGATKADLVIVALTNLFPKALLITNEIICLLKGGYPDGALARWRSLHEVAVTAMYISKHGEEVALAYLVSFHFSGRRAMHELLKHSDKSGIEPPTDEEMANFDALCADAEKALGRKIEKDKHGVWPAINPRGHRDFAAIEINVEMDHWRPRYKWASSYTHAGYRPHTNILGMSDTKGGGYLIGQSNGGFIDPLQMTAITLVQVTTTFLLYKTNADRELYAKIMLRLLDEMLNLPRCGETIQE